MFAKRFRFVSPGEVTVGVVRGAGDETVLSMKRLLAVQQKARWAQPHGVFEPKPGHVAVYCEFQEGNPGPVDLIDLRNVDLQILELNQDTTVFRINP